MESRYESQKMKNNQNDPVNSPNHYQGTIECIEAIEA